MIINHNMGALNANRQMGINQSAAGKSMEKLSSGLKINRAGDDAAGLAISEKMRGQIRGLDQASANAQDGISLIQTAEGGLNETHSILQRMRELSVQASNDTLQPEDRNAITTEIGQLTEEVTRISTDTKFNGKTLLSGTLGVKRDSGTLNTGVTGIANLSDIGVANAKASTTYTVSETATDISIADGAGNSQSINKADAGITAGGTLNFDSLGITIKTDTNYAVGGTAFDGLTVITGAASGATLQIGADASQTLALSVGDMSATGLAIDSLDVSDNTNANASITSLDAAINTVSTQRSNLGAWQNRLEHTIANLGTSSENLTSAESRIRDVDMAKEMSTFSKNNILSQAAQAMLAQANNQPQQVLQLLR